MIIPDDVMKKARECVATIIELVDARSHDYVSDVRAGKVDADLRDEIETTARAIMEERAARDERIGELEAVLAGAWITDRRHPDKTFEDCYAVQCLIVQRENGDVRHAAWNFEYSCWVDPYSDDFICAGRDVSAWRLLPSPPAIRGGE